MLSWLKCVGSVMGRSQVPGDVEADAPAVGLTRAARRARLGLHGSAGDLSRGLEHLEQRLVLSSGVDVVGPLPNAYTQGTSTWHGFNVEVLKGSWIITFTQRLSQQEATQKAQQVAAALGVTPDLVRPSTLGRFAEIRTRGQVTEAAVENVKASLPFVQQIEPNLLKHSELVPNDPRYNEQWALNNTGQLAGYAGAGTPGADIKAENAWNLTTGSDQVVVAVLDTGLDLFHPDIVANIYRNPGEIPANGVDDDGNGFVDDVTGWDFGGDGQARDNNPQDPVTQGHGTSVAGTIGAVGNNGIGVVGVAWNVKILPLKVFPDQGLAATFDIISANEYVAMMKGRGVNIVVTNNSYGALAEENFDQFNDAEEISVQAVTDAGIVFVASAGNDTNDNDGSVKAYPASYNNPDIVSVAATTNKDGIAGFSNFGATTVDVGAPGEQVLTLETGGGYRLIDGTSFSGPYTAGVVAMMASINRFATKQQLRSALLSSVDQIPALAGRVVTGGRVNLFKALNAIGVPGPVVAAISPGPQTAPVSQITVQFSKEMDASFFMASKVRLVSANGDNLFNSNDFDVALNPADISLVDSLLTINLAGDLPRDRYRLILANDGFRDTLGNRLNGNTVTGNDEVYDFNVVIFRGPLEPNDAISQATPVVLDINGSASFSDLVIGDGVNQSLDVDMFRLFANGPSLVRITVDARSLPVPSELDSFVRLFDTNGVELVRNDNFNGLDSRIEFFVPAGGFYYVGVSAYPNTAYLPNTEASGIVGDTLGSFGISFDVFTPGPDQRIVDNNTPTPIPDINVITSTIVITDERSIQDINVRVNITHSFVSDLRVRLTAPSGQVFDLINRRGGSGDNIVTTFDDQAASSILGGTAPYTGSFRPESNFNDLINTSAAGTWTLTIQDFKASDFGTLNSWGLELTLSNNLFGPYELNDATGLATDGGINGSGARTFDAAIGDGAYGLRDVDIFRVVANSGTTIQAFTSKLSANLDTIVRIFDASGNELAIDRRKGSREAQASYVVVNGGVFYIAVSGGNSTDPLNFGNSAYNPLVGGSGTVTDATGTYTLQISVTGGIGESSIVLAGNQLTVGLNTDATIGLKTGDTPAGIKSGDNEYLLLGQLESYFGFIADGFIGMNNADGNQTALGLSLVNESDYANRRASATGVYRGLQIKRSLSFGVNDRVIAVDVTLKNISSDTINDLAWVEGLNANQGLNFDGGDSETFNDVDATGRLATSTKNGLTLGIGAADTSFSEFASFENRGSVRDPLQVINSVTDPNGAESDLGMSLAFNLGTLIPNQAHTFRYFIFTGSAAQVLADFATVNAGTGAGHLVPDPNNTSIDYTDLPYALYYPEGFANSRANTFIPMINPHDESVRVVIIAHYEGTAPSEVLYDSATEAAGGLIGPNRRFGYTVSNPALFAAGDATRVGTQFAGRPGVLKKTSYSLEIRTSLPIGATFSNYDYNISTGEAFTSHPSTVWTFGDANRGASDRDFVLFYNPNNVQAKVTLTIYPESGSNVLTSTITVDPNRRSGWSLNKFIGLTNGKYALKLDSDLPIVAALTHYNIADKAGFASLGETNAGRTVGSTGEGEYGTNANRELVTILNANPQTATITLTLNYESGSAYRRTITAAANKRTTVDLATLPGITLGQPFSISYESNRPVTMSLTSYAFGEATGSVLASEAATQWLFGEGFRPASGARIRDYLRIFNPANTDARIAITLNYNTGESETFFRTVKARSANVFNLHDFVTGAKKNVNSFFSTKVQSAVPVVAFFGHFDRNLGGGFGSLGTPLGTLGSPA